MEESIPSIHFHQLANLANGVSFDKIYKVYEVLTFFLACQFHTFSPITKSDSQ